MPSKGLLLYFVLCTLAMVWPGALIANRIDPIILGMPFFMFWYVAWVFALFVGLVIAYRKDAEKEVDHE
ncbi:DUF3311 domain-containing protein [Halomonas sp. DP4Y7-1]|nr:DUF3311 domain-containing protein [Halomonas litopenaei]MBY5926306.1 DUF3311 domain-containing protein [Halomonas sp. DP4Y7-2]MBY5929978.1 DUF3311 domain-containing protein [Halomonas sp. DP8Y7-3]MBY5969941.1 DUF3311 domain-containing protein [Halomonas denitrificans]MBY6030113.1 DUF3311 domain-containing protein [Halomonas sp. DP8Y7-1]MBY6209719.1 DUF3311 domain-containing protein [Halomonas sp. DP3Y7-2]MBY6229938.1 DUF3311 domain-containing protein [Halomonas sp. DP3Y7-1]MBY6233348.1 DU